MKILLVRPDQPRATRGLRHITVCEPLELEYLAAAVPGHSVRLVDMLLGDDLETAIDDFGPTLLGTTGYINNVPEALAVCRRAKARDAGITTVIGGVHATLHPGDLEAADVDLIAIGEGVAIFRDLVAALERGTGWERIPGIAYRTGGRYRYTPARPFCTDVDALPLPDRSISRAHHARYHYLDCSPLAIMKTSWGCPYDCAFCYNRELTGRRYAARSARSIVAELKTIAAPHVFIVDDLFFHSPRRLEALYRLIRAERIEKEYAAYSRVDFIVNHPEILKKWRSIGLRVLRVGMEAVRDHELEAYGKRTSVDLNRRAVEICRELGIYLSASFLMDPDYRRRDFARVRRFLKETGLVHVFINPLTPLPGTRIHARYRHRIIADHRRMAALWDFQHLVVRPGHLSLPAFYRQMTLTYLSVMNPLRRNRMILRKHPYPLFSWRNRELFCKVVAILVEMFFAHHDHRRLLARQATGRS